MVENRPWHDFFAHAVLIAGVILVAFPLYVTFIASTQTYEQIVSLSFLKSILRLHLSEKKSCFNSWKE